MDETIFILTSFPDSKLFEMAYATGEKMRGMTDKILDNVELTDEELKEWDRLGGVYARVCAVIESRGQFENYKEWREIQHMLP